MKQCLMIFYITYYFLILFSFSENFTVCCFKTIYPIVMKLIGYIEWAIDALYMKSQVILGEILLLLNIHNIT